MKKNLTTLVLLAFLTVSAMAQLFEKSNHGLLSDYKKHYSHNIEGGTVDGVQKEFVIGNNTDFLTVNNKVSGQSVTGNFIGQGVIGELIVENIALTDFAVFPSTENQYAVGTGIYYPDIPNDYSGYPFMGIYDRRTMTPINLYFYNISYPVDKKDKNSVGLRIKYSERNNSVYISGILCENVLPQMNMNDLVGKSQGFILKIDFANPTSAQALVFDPDDVSVIPILSAVTDMEIDNDEQEIIFTGINTKQSTEGYYSPFAGKIDMNLNLLWSNTYSFGTDRFSGVDVEYSSNGNFLMLMNSDKYDFAIMEIGSLGQVIQQPVKYTFSYNNEPWPARSHIMHYNKSNIYITGNLFEAERSQRLYSYKIADATNLLSGGPEFKMYSEYPIPQGKQVEATNYWAPENSILTNENDLSIVGIYNNIGAGDDEFGFCLVHTAGYDSAACMLTGKAYMKSDYCDSHSCEAHLITCRSIESVYLVYPGLETFYQSCPSHDKSIMINDRDNINFGWQIDAINEAGMVLTFANEETSKYMINVYTTTGTRVHSENVSINGQQTVYLNFKTTDQIYLINVNNGITSETRKVAVIR